jgi:hypothetical protein
MQNAVFNVVLAGWLREDRLLSKDEVVSSLKSKGVWLVFHV